MLIDMDFTIAYKCSSCGKFEFISLNLFKLLMSQRLIFKCVCNNAQAELIQYKQGEYSVTIPCIGCGSKHSYNIDRKDILNKSLKVFTCPYTNIQQCFIGIDNEVRQYIDNLEKEMDVLMDGLGYESYFANTQVMLDTLNRVHDLAERGKLYCECGSDDVAVSMWKKGIFLKCTCCSRSKFIPAASNGDLKNTFLRGRIILSRKGSKSVL